MHKRHLYKSVFISAIFGSLITTGCGSEKGSETSLLDTREELYTRTSEVYNAPLTPEEKKQDLKTVATEMTPDNLEMINNSAGDLSESGIMARRGLNKTFEECRSFNSETTDMKNGMQVTSKMEWKNSNGRLLEFCTDMSQDDMYDAMDGSIMKVTSEGVGDSGTMNMELGAQISLKGGSFERLSGMDMEMYGLIELENARNFNIQAAFDASATLVNDPYSMTMEMNMSLSFLNGKYRCEISVEKAVSSDEDADLDVETPDSCELTHAGTKVATLYLAGDNGTYIEDLDGTIYRGNAENQITSLDEDAPAAN
jgi:hypothetical protein